MEQLIRKYSMLDWLLLTLAKDRILLVVTSGIQYVRRKVIKYL